MNVFRKVVDWVKGEQRVVDRVFSTEIFEGKFPAAGNYSEEQYRVRVDRHRVTLSWDCQWIKPTHSFYCVVNPLMSHRLPIDVRCKSILISNTLSKETYQTDDVNEAISSYVAYVTEQRFKFQRKAAG